MDEEQRLAAKGKLCRIYRTKSHLHPSNAQAIIMGLESRLAKIAQYAEYIPYHDEDLEQIKMLADLTIAIDPTRTG